MYYYLYQGFKIEYRNGGQVSFSYKNTILYYTISGREVVM